MPVFRGPDEAAIIVDRVGRPIGTVTNPVVVTGSTTTSSAEGLTGAAVPAYGIQIAGPDAANLLRAPKVLNTAPTGTENGMVVRDPALTDGTQLAQVTGTGTAGSPAAGVVTVQGIPGGTPVPISGTISATNPSVGLTGAAVPTSATFGGAEDGTGNLVGVEARAAAPAGTERGLITRNIPSGTQAVSAAALPLPTGAATEATLAGVLTTTAFQARINVLGQNTMANSTPVVLASDQSALPVAPVGTGAVVTIVPGLVTVFTLLAANATRKGAAFWNDSGRNLYIKMGSAASLTSYTVRVANNGYYEVPFNYTGIVTAICAGLLTNDQGNAVGSELIGSAQLPGTTTLRVPRPACASTSCWRCPTPRRGRRWILLRP